MFPSGYFAPSYFPTSYFPVNLGPVLPFDLSAAIVAHAQADADLMAAIPGGLFTTSSPPKPSYPYATFEVAGDATETTKFTDVRLTKTRIKFTIMSTDEDSGNLARDQLGETFAGSPDSPIDPRFRGVSLSHQRGRTTPLVEGDRTQAKVWMKVTGNRDIFKATIEFTAWGHRY